jgi:hypothetical protein
MSAPASGVKIKITRGELRSIIETAERVAHRTNSRVFIRWDRIQIID